MIKVKDVRELLLGKLNNNEFVIDKSGQKTIEIIGETFIANEDTIFGTLNKNWCERELEWYLSQSLDVNDIPGDTPQIWKHVADINGEINSNYGYLIFSKENGNQFNNVLLELSKNKDSRRAEMIYTRPSMHTDYNKNGKSDFVCTDSVSYFIRDNKLISHVKMRSNDAVFGYKGDRYWQKWVQEKLAKELNIECGEILWTASSLHIYERHFKLLG